MFVLIVAIVVVLLQLLLFSWLVSIFSLLLHFTGVRIFTRTNAANTAITTFILFTSIRFSTITATNTMSITIMNIFILATISMTVVVTSTLTSFIVLIRIIMISTIVAIIVTLVTNCSKNVSIVPFSVNASISIPAPIRLLSLSLLVRVPRVHNN